SDGYTPVLVEARQGRDRLQREGEAFVTRRSGERFSRAQLERIAVEAPDRLSPNVLLRPVVEAALLPTVAYAAGPAELQYLQDALPLYTALGVTRQPPVPRCSGVIVEGRADKLMARHGLDLAAFDGRPGAPAPAPRSIQRDSRRSVCSPSHRSSFATGPAWWTRWSRRWRAGRALRRILSCGSWSSCCSWP